MPTEERFTSRLELCGLSPAHSQITLKQGMELLELGFQAEVPLQLRRGHHFRVTAQMLLLFTFVPAIFQGILPLHSVKIL